MENVFKYASGNIRLLLQYKGWTCGKLAETIGISEVTLRRRLNAKSITWKMTEATAISRALGASVNDIFFSRMLPIGNKAEEIS